MFFSLTYPRIHCVQQRQPEVPANGPLRAGSGTATQFEFTHGQPSPLYCHSETLWSTQGTQQGEPPGPTFFAAAIQHATSSLRDLPGIAWQIWYLYDGALVGDTEALMNALHELTLLFRQLGLEVNLVKCKTWSP